jgi:hypothetical protein
VHLHNYLRNQFHNVFIAGPQELIEYLKDYYDSQKTHSQASLTYPFTQVNKNGYVYTKEQNYKLPFVHPLEDDNIWQDDEEECDKYINYSPLFNAPVSVIDWYLDLNKVTMKHPEADIYFSNSIVNAYLHRMLISNLDKLASANKNYFIPMHHHHIIDPNLTAVIQKIPDNDPTYQWKATDLIIEEYTIFRFNTLATLQLSFKRHNFKVSKFILETLKVAY